jgi:hypothetical protein
VALVRSLRVKKIAGGVAIEGRPMDLAIFADVLMRLAEAYPRFPLAPRIGEIGVMIVAAMTGRDPAPPDGSDSGFD